MTDQRCDYDFFGNNLSQSPYSETRLLPDPIHGIPTNTLDFSNERILRLIIDRTYTNEEYTMQK